MNVGIAPVRVNHPDDIQEITTELKTNLGHDFQVFRYQLEAGYMIAALTGYDGQNVEVSGMAKGKWFHPDIYANLFDHIFRTNECKRATFIVDKDNHKCINLLEKGGCVFECELRGIGRLLYSMTPEDFYGKTK